MDLYHIPDEQIGQKVDGQGYLWVDESVDVLAKEVFHGERNKSIRLKGSKKIRTATFLINDAVFSAEEIDHDIILKADGADAVLIFVRVIRL